MHNQINLLDLDELVLLCRDEKARAYINEAVSSYRSGAFRAAIVVTWVAVCYDIIDKLREIALSGDKEAAQSIKFIEDARKRNDVTALLQFEKEILSLAETKFELLSSSEKVDLARLQYDRNLCAHPSMISEDQSFSPPGELARLHIRSAVIHLLQHQPVQGKYAFERILREIESEYFPSSKKDAIIALSNGPLRRARKSLVRSVCTVIIKELIFGSVDYKSRARFYAALEAIMSINRAYFLEVINEQIPKILCDMPDERLKDLTHVVARMPEIMNSLPKNVSAKVGRFIENIPTDEFGMLEFYDRCEHLKPHTVIRMSKAIRKDFDDSIFFELPATLCDRLIELYTDSDSFAEANWAATTIMRNLENFSEQQKISIVKIIKTNDQIYNSNTLSTLISKIRETMGSTCDDFEKALVEHGLEKFAKIKPDLDDDIPF
jgi:hypothetical protein